MTTNPFNLTAYRVRFKASARSQNVFEWTRFSVNVDAATEAAREVLRREFFGKAVLVSVEETVWPN